MTVFDHRGVQAAPHHDTESGLSLADAERAAARCRIVDDSEGLVYHNAVIARIIERIEPQLAHLVGHPDFMADAGAIVRYCLAQLRSNPGHLNLAYVGVMRELGAGVCAGYGWSLVEHALRDTAFGAELALSSAPATMASKQCDDRIQKMTEAVDDGDAALRVPPGDKALRYELMVRAQLGQYLTGDALGSNRFRMFHIVSSVTPEHDAEDRSLAMDVFHNRSAHAESDSDVADLRRRIVSLSIDGVRPVLRAHACLALARAARASSDKEAAASWLCEASSALHGVRNVEVDKDFVALVHEMCVADDMYTTPEVREALDKFVGATISQSPSREYFVAMWLHARAHEKVGLVRKCLPLSRAAVEAMTAYQDVHPQEFDHDGVFGVSMHHMRAEIATCVVDGIATSKDTSELITYGPRVAAWCLEAELPCEAARVALLTGEAMERDSRFAGATDAYTMAQSYAEYAGLRKSLKAKAIHTRARAKIAVTNAAMEGPAAACTKLEDIATSLVSEYSAVGDTPEGALEASGLTRDEYLRVLSHSWRDVRMAQGKLLFQAGDPTASATMLDDVYSRAREEGDLEQALMALREDARVYRETGWTKEVGELYADGVDVACEAKNAGALKYFATLLHEFHVRAGDIEQASTVRERYL